MFQLNKDQEKAIKALTRYPEFGVFVDMMEKGKDMITNLRYDIGLELGEKFTPEAEIVGRRLAERIIDKALLEMKVVGIIRPKKDNTYE